MVKFEEKTAYHAETEEEAWWLLQEADKQGYKWCNGQSFLKNNNYKSYSNNTCYFIKDGTFADLGYFVKREYKITKVKNLITEKIIELW